MLTQAKLKAKFDYRADGWLVRKTTGVPSGYVRDDDYIDVQIDNKTYRAHRLVWLWHHGSFAARIRHINKNHQDNRIENLTDGNRSI